MYEHGWEKMICQSDRAIGRFIGAEQEICPTKTVKKYLPNGFVTTQNTYLMVRSVLLSFLPPIIIMSLLISGPDPTDGWRE